MTHLDLFSGIGGFALAARWMGWETVGFVEIDKFCQKVLKKNFPNVPIYGDIKQFNGTEWAGKIDVLTGGFPCQPFSVAGKRKGKEDDRYLWPEMLRVIGEVQPAFVVGENVYGLLNWSRGMVFDQVQTDLVNIGYEVTPFVLPACAKNAPHRRDRVWFVANSCNNGHLQGFGENGEAEGKDKSNGHKWEWVRNEPERTIIEGASSNPHNHRDDHPNGTEENHLVWHESKNQKQPRNGWTSEDYRHSSRLFWEGFPVESPLYPGDDGVSTELVRQFTIHAAGNAIVPQVAFEIFKAISSTMK